MTQGKAGPAGALGWKGRRSAFGRSGSSPSDGFWLTLAFAMIFAVSSLIWTIAHDSRPFPGFWVLRGGYVDGVMSPQWTGPRAGIQPGDQVIGVDGWPLDAHSSLYAHVASQPAGTTIRYDVVRQNRQGEQRLRIDVPTQLIGRDWLGFHFLPWLMGIVHLVIGAGVHWLHPGHRATRLHWYYCLSLAIFTTAIAGISSGHWFWGGIGACGEWAMGLTGTALAMHVPRRWPVLTSHPRTVYAVGVAATLALIACQAHYTFNGHYGAAMTILLAAAVGTLIMPAAAAWTLGSRGSRPLERAQARIILAGALMAYLPALVLVLSGNALGIALPYQELSYLLGILFPAAVAYAIVRQQLFGIQPIIRRTGIYTALVACLGGLYLLVVTLTVGALNGLFPGSQAGGLPGFLAVLTVVAVAHPLRSRLETLVDKWFAPRPLDPLQLLTDLTETASGPPTTVSQSIVARIGEHLACQWAYLRLTDRHVATWGDVPAHVLTQPPEPGSDDGTVSVAITGPQGVEGLLVLGLLPTDDSSEPQEEVFLSLLASQAALALQASRLLADSVRLQVASARVTSVATERQHVLDAVAADLQRRLQAIRQAAAMLGDDGAALAPLQTIQTELASLQRYLDDQTDRMQQPYPANPIRLAPATERVAEAKSEALDAKWLRLQATCATDPVVLPLDEQAFEQVIHALLDHAIKASPPTSTIRLQLTVDTETLSIAVEDAGVSLPKGDAPTPDAPGPFATSLSLAMALTVVEAVKGRLSWQNGATGVTVKAQLPLILPKSASAVGNSVDLLQQR